MLVNEKLGRSDHHSVMAELRIPVPRIAAAERKIYLYSKGDYESFSEAVKATDWDKEFHRKNVEDSWTAMKEKYNMWVEKFVPTKTVKSGQRHKLPWASYKSVKRAKHAKRAAKVKAKKSDLNVHNLQFDQAKKDVENALYKAKLDYESSLVNKIKTEPKMFYNYARHFTRSSSTVEVLEKDGVKVTEDCEKAEILNDFFASVLKVEPEEDIINFPLHNSATSANIYDIVITPDTVREKLLKLHLNKACGPDGLHVNVMRNVPDFDIPFCLIFTKSLQTGVVPQDWRDANITPLFKKGSRLSPNNYRPVSLIQSSGEDS